MGLPNSYTIKNGAIPAYFDAILNASAPERFSYKFLEGLGFTSTNDRLLVSILKELGFLNSDGTPVDRYYNYLDRSKSDKILAEGIKECYAELFAVNNSAHKLSADEANNKLRALYRGQKSDDIVKRISKTFYALCQLADFEKETVKKPKNTIDDDLSNTRMDFQQQNNIDENTNTSNKKTQLNSLQYHINIVLPDTRDQAVYDAIFKSLRDHLG